MTPTPSLRHAGAALPLLLAGSAFAHPHANAPALGFFEGLVHMLSQPDHLAMLSVAVAVAVAGVRAQRSRRANKPTRLP